MRQAAVLVALGMLQSGRSDLIDCFISKTIYAIYVLDPLSKKLVKTITLRRLITGDPQAPGVVRCPWPILQPWPVWLTSVRGTTARQERCLGQFGAENPRGIGMATQIVMDPTGDTRHNFDAADIKALSRAEERFKALTSVGFTAAVRTAAGEVAVTRSFDPTAEETLFFPRLVGG